MYGVSSYNKGASNRLAAQANVTEAYVLKPGITWKDTAETRSVVYMVADVMSHLNVILDTVQPKLVLVNTTAVTAETLGVLTTHYLKGVCVVGVLDVMAKAGSTGVLVDPPMVHILFHTKAFLHKEQGNRERLAQAMSSCMMAKAVVEGVEQKL
jgi:hypothetical protein